MMRAWAWHADDLHYASVWEMLRKNIRMWLFNVVFALASLVVFFYASGWWKLYWFVLAGWTIFIIWFYARKSWRRVQQHMASDRAFLTNLEEGGMPEPLAMNVLLALEREDVHPAQALWQALRVFHEWRQDGVELPPYPAGEGKKWTPFGESDLS